MENAPTPPPAGRLSGWVLAAAVAGLLLVCYWPALRGALIWNDRDYVTRPELRSLAGLGRIWSQPGATEQYYPVLHSAFWLQCRLWGEDPLGYRLVTLALHAGAAVLFALVLRRLAVPGAVLAAFLFALHPVHVQSVAWISEQKNTLSLVLYLGAALAYLRFDESRQRRAYAAALGLFVLSLLCKTVTATLPAALLVVLWWRRGRLEARRDVVPLLPWLALGAAAGVFTSWVEQHFVGARGENFALPFLERGLVAGRAVWIYLGHLLWPARLNFIYPRWTPDPTAFGQWLALLAVPALAAGLWAWRRHSRAPLAVFLLFAGSLLPVLGFVNLYGALYSWVWDHWQYLPDLAPLALAAAGLARGWSRLGPRWRPLAPAAAGLLVVALGALTWRHAGTFRDEETLYRGTLARNPAAWMAHNNLASLLVDRPGRAAEAVAHYREALRLRPEHYHAHVNLANLLVKLPGGQDEALAHFEEALRLKPDYAEAHNYLANLLAGRPGRTADALAHYAEALRLKPDYAAAHNNLAGLLATLPGRQTEALAHYREALRLDPEFAEACNNLANQLAQLPGHDAEAIALYARALRINPGLAPAHHNLALVLARQGRLAEAIAHCTRALELDPGFAAARQTLAYLQGLKQD
jgi:tetratricopeptide (TPR) repeat protein